MQKNGRFFDASIRRDFEIATEAGLAFDIRGDLLRLYREGWLLPLLMDRTKRAPIVWGNLAYAHLGEAYAPQAPMGLTGLLANDAAILQTRAQKAEVMQSTRTRRYAEVFTPIWLCSQMIDCIEADGAKLVPGGAESSLEKPLTAKNWRKNIQATWLEITCGEAPFIVQRYDSTTGRAIELENRRGILDRKLQIVGANAANETEYLEYAFKALKSCYAYELQGDSLLIARINILLSFEFYVKERLQRRMSSNEYAEAIDIISWNIWQMDGLKRCLPFAKNNLQANLFDWLNGKSKKSPQIPYYCQIYNWKNRQAVSYDDLIQRSVAMKFDFIIGNPPYQEETDSESTRMPPVYHMFMDDAYKISDRVLLITPARFLFNTGFTPKEWNEKMLNDEHIKIVSYQQKSADVFDNTDIKGGVVVILRDAKKKYEPIKVFQSIQELNSVLHKVLKVLVKNVGSIVYPALSYKLSQKMLMENPMSLDRLRTSAFSKLNIFYDSIPNDGNEYFKMLGLLNGNRVMKYVRSDYIDKPDNFNKYKVILPESNGSGAIGEVLSTPLIGAPLIGAPLIGHTQTFISIGAFTNEVDAQSCLKYIKSKFARTMLGILKVTQHNPASAWRYVPLQDFSSSSDIDWSLSVADIDKQLYKKYGLDEAEIAFIETHVKEMA